jgi:iron(III) transport system substrate-binding protein
MSEEKRKLEDGNWPKDDFGHREVIARFWFMWPVLVLCFVGVVSAFSSSLFKSKPTVVAYCAQDEDFAEPLLRNFEKETGVKVRAVYDSEAVKTVGLANRLMAERSHPQCDVFWGNEEMRTRLLASQGLFRETNGWAAFGYRSRRLVINTNLVPLANAPASFHELTNQFWKGKVALAYPQFGTTATHFHALRQLWGDAGWRAWCQALAANKPLLVDGNSVVVKMVARGEAAVGMSDSDDIAAGRREGLPVTALPMTPETLLIPNTIALIRGGPHPEAADQLFDYLQGAETGKALVSAEALEGVSVREVTTPTLTVNWDQLLQELDATTSELNKIFLR